MLAFREKLISFETIVELTFGAGGGTNAEPGGKPVLVILDVKVSPFSATVPSANRRQTTTAITYFKPNI